jgi:hypothetical protein
MVRADRAEIKHDIAIIKNALSLILEPGQVTELRALDASTPTYRNPHTEAGYFNDLDKLARAAASIRAMGVYIIPNPVNPSLLGRAVNKIRPAPKNESTTDTNIVCRRWLLIDADPIRPAGIASTDAEHKAALDAAAAVAEALARDGWPPPLVADSGNGGHLMYRIDLPAVDGGLLQRCLEALAEHDSELVKIDKTVFNPSRIWKLYGTIAAKGDADAEAIGRPHRLARIISAPAKLEVVPAELLESLAGKAPPTPSNGKGKAKAAGNAGANHKPRSGFNLETWIAEHNLQVTGPEKWKDGRRWTFRVCPFNSEHTNEAAYIVQFGSGAIAAGCHHNSCADKDWHALRDLVEPGWRARQWTPPDPDAESRRNEPLDWLRGQTMFANIPIVSVRKLGAVRGEYDLILDDGREVMLGSAADVLNHRAVQSAIADATGITIPQFGRDTWQPIGAAIIAAAEIVDCATDPNQELRAMIERYLGRGRKLVVCSNVLDLVKVVRIGSRHPAKNEKGQIFLSIEEFHEHLVLRCSVRITQPELARRLRRARWTPQQLSARDGENVLKARVWVSPPKWDSEDG